jgi:hypothetical protein
MSGRYTIPARMKTEAITTKGTNIVPSQLGHNKAPSDHQPQEAEGDEASEEDLAHNKEGCSPYSVDRIRDTQLGPAKLQYRSKRRELRLKHSRFSRSKSYILLRIIPHTFLSMWEIDNHFHIPTVSVASTSHYPATWALPQPPIIAPTSSHDQQPEGQRQTQQQHNTREESESRTANSNVLYSRHIY